MKNIIILVCIICNFSAFSQSKIDLNQNERTSINLDIDWGVWARINGKEFCTSWAWICKVTYIKIPTDQLKDNLYNLTLDDNILKLTFKNNILTSEEYQSLFGNEVFDFNSNGTADSYTLNEEICKNLGLDIGYKIQQRKYNLDKSQEGFTTIIFDQK